MQNPAGVAGPARPSARPFVGGRPPAPIGAARSTRSRPFAPEARTRTPAPVAGAFLEYEAGLPPVYESPALLPIRAPGFEHAPAALELPPAEDDYATTAIAVEGAPVASLAAAMLDAVAERLRRGEIELAPGSRLDSEAAAVAAVLQALDAETFQGL